MTYCQSCDKYISQKFIKKHNKSKSHLYFHNNFDINKHYINNIQWKDFENIIKDYIDEYNTNFGYFSIKIEFELNNNKYSIAINNNDVEIPLYKFDNDWIYYKFSQSEKVKNFVIYNACLRDINLESTSIINIIILTIFSKYKTMKRYHLLNQNRSILESKLLKHIHNSNFNDKLTKYKFLSQKYNFI